MLRLLHYYYIIQTLIKTMKQLISFTIIIITTISIYAQQKKELTEIDRFALEGIIVEQYHVADSIDYADTVGGILAKGSVTYRIYIDLKPGYTLQAVYGVPNHELSIETTSVFYNNIVRGNITGDLIDDKKINENNVALDSWLSMGAATKLRFGIPKTDDRDGSIIQKKSFANADGLVIGNVPHVAYFGLDLSFFNNEKTASSFRSNNGSVAVFGGAKGFDNDNRILIAQLTTNGKLSFELNIQIGTPSGGTVQYVANNPEGAEIKYAALTYSKKK